MRVLHSWMNLKVLKHCAFNFVIIEHALNQNIHCMCFIVKESWVYNVQWVLVLNCISHVLIGKAFFMLIIHIICFLSTLTCKEYISFSSARYTRYFFCLVFSRSLDSDELTLCACVIHCCQRILDIPSKNLKFRI